jgi:hypothetical protein
MFVLSWKLTALTIALAPICILAAVISSFISSNLKIKRLASDERAAAVARLSMQTPAAVKALCIEDAVAAHYGAFYDSFVASFSPFKNSVCRILVSTSFQVPSATKSSEQKSSNTFNPPALYRCLHVRWLPTRRRPASSSPPLPLTLPPLTLTQVQPGFLVSFFLFLVVLASSIGQLPAVRAHVT